MVVEKNGERLAAIVPIQMLDKWEEERTAFFDQMRVVSERADVSFEEAQELAADAIQAVRVNDKETSSPHSNDLCAWSWIPILSSAATSPVLGHLHISLNIGNKEPLPS